uniref:Uncharacterized protein n=1 Tax=Oryza meridionalis TaxID=40149 RepID=A0A0E0DVZ8_9ORYZ
MTCSSWNSSSDLLRRLRHRHRPTSQRMSDNLKTRNSVLCLSCLPIKHEGTTDISDPPGQMVVPSSYLRSTSTDGRPRRRGRLLRRVQLVQDTIAIGNHLDCFVVY